MTGTHRGTVAHVRTWVWRLSVVFGALLLGAMLASGWYTASYTGPLGARATALGVGNGVAVLAITDAGVDVAPSWSLERFEPSWRWWFTIDQTPKSSQMMVPLWAPALVVLGLGLWVRSKRMGEGRCAGCGYALDGADPGAPCPECGATITRA